jgi:hypothetical protein
MSNEWRDRELGEFIADIPIPPDDPHFFRSLGARRQRARHRARLRRWAGGASVLAVAVVVGGILLIGPNAHPTNLPKLALSEQSGWETLVIHQDRSVEARAIFRTDTTAPTALLTFLGKLPSQTAYVALRAAATPEDLGGSTAGDSYSSTWPPQLGSLVRIKSTTGERTYVGLFRYRTSYIRVTVRTAGRPSREMRAAIDRELGTARVA